LELDFSHYNPSVFDIPEISYEEIDYSLSKLKSKRSSGPDLIPSFIIKETGQELKKVLYFIFNLSIRSGEFPKSWKVTKVSPIHKKGDKSDIQNYRPVAILSAPAKLLEIIIHKRIWHNLSHFIVDEQHGFRPTRSTVTNLLSFGVQVGGSLNANTQCDVVYMDFQKAFDKVDHGVLLSKLNLYGLSDGMIKYMMSYLCERQQYVSFQCHNSETFFTYSGVPQGSNLGPLLFTIFINDIGSCIKHSRYLLYADDLKLFREIRCQYDANQLQQDLDSLVSWSFVNRLFFSPPKCFVMSYSRSRDPILMDYTMNNSTLLRVTEIKDLGVIYTCDLSFKQHIITIVKKASMTLGFVLRNAAYFKNPRTLNLLYETLVRTILESASIIWAPHQILYELMIERIQKKFARHLYRLTYGYYPYLFPSLFVMGCLGMSTLRKRRDEYLCRHFFKLINGIIHNPVILREMKFYVPDAYSRSRSHVLFYPPRSRTNLVSNSPIGKVITILNILSADIDLFNISYSEFIKRIEIML
jgi:hypothetical protein